MSYQNTNLIWKKEEIPNKYIKNLPTERYNTLKENRERNEEATRETKLYVKAEQSADRTLTRKVLTTNIIPNENTLHRSRNQSLKTNEGGILKALDKIINRIENLEKRYSQSQDQKGFLTPNRF